MINKKKKLVIGIPNFDYAGAEIMVEQLTTNIDNTKYDINVICLGKNNETKMEKNILSKGIKINYFNKKRGLSIKTLVEVFKYLKRTNPDIIHTNMGIVAYTIPWAILNRQCKCIHTVHCLPQIEGNFILRKALRIVYKKDIIEPVAISNKIAKQLNDMYKIKENNIHIIYNPVNISKFNIKKEKDYSKIVLINVARCVPLKNQKLLIECFNDIANKYNNIYLNIIGNGDSLEEYKNFAKSLNIKNKVLFTGNVDNVEEYLSKSDIFVLPSLYEGLPMSILEAMAAGLPIIASDVGGIPDIVKNNGIVVEVNNKEKLYEALDKLISNKELREKMGKNSLENVEKFDIKNIINEYEKIYEE